jgi:predicted dinucleotide-binding enzyme
MVCATASGRLLLDIGVIGSGNIGANAARLFARAGHRVAISNSRGPETLRDLLAEIGANARAVTVEEAADFGEVVFEAIPFGRYGELPAERLEGKILVDAANYYPGRDGEIDLGGLGSSEVLARHVPGARVVKAFNTMYYETLLTGGGREDRLVLFVAGDDEEAKATVSRLIEEIGFAPVDTGSLRDGRKQEPGSPVYNKPMTEAEAREALAGLG